MHRELPSDDLRFQKQTEHQHFIFEGIEYPVSRADLIEIAADAEYDPDTLNLVRSLPERIFTSRDDIWRSIGEATRRLAGGGNAGGAPRDDLGKQASLDDDGTFHRP